MSAFEGVFKQGYLVKEWNNGEDRAYAIGWNEGFSFDGFNGYRTVPGWYCGYVLLKDSVLDQDDSFKGFVNHIPTHRGISFHEQHPQGYVYGFDCGHAGDELDPNCSDLDWLSRECEKLGEAIYLCKPFQAAYREQLEDDDAGRWEVGTQMWRACREQSGENDTLSLTQMLSIVTGIVP